MRPRTKLQKEVFKLSQHLPSLTDFQYKEAIRKAAPHIAKCNVKGEYVCLDCAHKWFDAIKEQTVCPHCGAKLEVNTSRKRNFSDSSYVAVVSKCQGFQVVRMFFFNTYLRCGEKAKYWIDEAFQRWFTSDGQCVIVGRAKRWMGGYMDAWNFSSDMEIRKENNGHYVTAYKVIGKTSVTPILKRNGFDGDFHDADPNYLFMALLTNPRIETLWKAGQYSLARYSMIREYTVNSFWDSVKVAIRHKYNVTDASMWFDMLYTMARMDKDIHNPKFICPPDLKAAHDDWLQKQQAYDRKQEQIRAREREQRREREYLENLKRVEEDEQAYKAAKSQYFDFKIEDGELTIKPLVSVREFVEEGHNLHHCVFTNRYYRADDSLILHALTDGFSIATIELSLTNFQIIQCRGVHNSIPPHKERICQLINKNINQIVKLSEIQTA